MSVTAIVLDEQCTDALLAQALNTLFSSSSVPFYLKDRVSHQDIRAEYKKLTGRELYRVGVLTDFQADGLRAVDEDLGRVEVTVHNFSARAAQ